MRRLARSHSCFFAMAMVVQNVGIGTDWGFWTTDFPVELRPRAMRSFAATSGFRFLDRSRR